MTGIAPYQGWQACFDLLRSEFPIAASHDEQSSNACHPSARPPSRVPNRSPANLCRRPERVERRSHGSLKSAPVSPSELPPGWTYNPSRWSERLPVLALALTGFGIAAYLGMYQLGAFPVVWEPFFGDGSHRILKESSIAHLLPVPDAILGAVVYLLDATAGSIGGRRGGGLWLGLSS